ncbi:MAG: hypothetical protein QOE70_6421 [Chthoniobacter sp.]|jgi:opacity protein-like surface antigen|nr:hypothetical protein [Chthoniobacter sp.]
MKRQANHFRALAVYFALGCALPLSADAGREMKQGESTAGIEPINAVEPLIAPVAPARKWRLDGSLSAAAIYNDNIFIGATGKMGDVLLTISPSVSLTLGSPDGQGAGYLTLNYAPGFVHYAEHSAQDSISHSALFNTGYRFTRLSLSLSLGYHQGRETDVEVGALVDHRNYSAALTSKYELTDRSSVDLSLSKSFSDYDGFLDVSEMVVQGYFNSRITEAITLGVGVAYGSAEAQGSTAQGYEQVTMRAAYSATERLSLSANVGGDFRNSGDGNQCSPIFGLGANYKPFDSTDVSLSGSRSIVPSAVLVHQDKELTSFFLSVRQRFLQRYFLTPSVGYDHTEYGGSAEGVGESRNDDSIAFGLNAATNLTEHWSVQLFYQYRRNTSTAEGFSFTNNQLGLSSAVSF